jgi:hypothetical protein
MLVLNPASVPMTSAPVRWPAAVVPLVLAGLLVVLAIAMWVNPVDGARVRGTARADRAGRVPSWGARGRSAELGGVIADRRPMAVHDGAGPSVRRVRRPAAPHRKMSRVSTRGPGHARRAGDVVLNHGPDHRGISSGSRATTVGSRKCAGSARHPCTDPNQPGPLRRLVGDGVYEHWQREPAGHGRSSACDRRRCGRRRPAPDSHQQVHHDLSARHSGYDHVLPEVIERVEET